MERLFSEKGLPAARLDSETTRIPLFIQNTVGPMAPVMPIVFIAACAYAQQPELVNIACSIIATYVTEFFATRRSKGVACAKVTIAVETTRKKQTKLLSYEGPVEGMKELPKEIWAVANEVSQ